MTDREYAERLAVLAVAALRKNQRRCYQMSWDEITYSAVHGWNEQEYAAAVAPSVVLRLLRRLERLEGVGRS